MTTRSKSYQQKGSTIPAIVEGIVVNINDPQQQGRVQVWCPGIDGENYNADSLPWAKVSSVLAGQVNRYPGGSRGISSGGLMAYGFWAIPRVNTTVTVALLYGNPNNRRVLGSDFSEHGNRSIPTGRNRPDIGVNVPVTDTLEPVQPQTMNMLEQFGGNIDAPEARTRGAYERQAAQDKDVRDGSEGYQPSPFDGEENILNPQTYAFVTPGRNAIIFQDNPETARLRIKTSDGNQIILDDTNERIYVSTSHGKSWFEMDKDGHIHAYGAQSMSVGAGVDINLTAGRDVNITALRNINMSSTADFNIRACGKLSAYGAGLNIESGKAMNILAAGNLLQTASMIHLNGPTAEATTCPDNKPIVPNHEPWQRPESPSKRGPNWKK